MQHERQPGDFPDHRLGEKPPDEVRPHRSVTHDHAGSPVTLQTPGGGMKFDLLKALSAVESIAVIGGILASMILSLVVTLAVHYYIGGRNN